MFSKRKLLELVSYQQKEIDDLKKDQIILLDNSQELRTKIKDLENNVEFLVNNLSKQKKKLIRPGNQN